ncbi:hypothetical protein [Streptomyces canus]|uniref:hypothetical protein n=1 Tax=Streptomyces canus TaxID=58343 RepID=UPI002E2EA56A|nr:hypothetical protein [Streptomyces canus]
MKVTERLIDTDGFVVGGDALVKATGRLIATGQVRLGGCDAGGDALMKVAERLLATGRVRLGGFVVGGDVS